MSVMDAILESEAKVKAEKEQALEKGKTILETRKISAEVKAEEIEKESKLKAEAILQDAEKQIKEDTASIDALSKIECESLTKQADENRLVAISLIKERVLNL
jgi:hypothetical protein